MKLFTKTTDRKMLLKYESSHPPHIKKALPYIMMMRRIVKICSEPSDKWKELEILGEKGFLKALLLERETCLSEKSPRKEGPEETFLVTTFSSSFD